MSIYNHQTDNMSNLDNPTVFSATHAEISKTARTQCKKHKWEKLSENEIYCPVCETGAIVKNINDYIHD